MIRRLGIERKPAHKLKPEVTWLAVAVATAISAAGDFVIRGWRTFALVEFGLVFVAAGVSAVLWMRSRRHPGRGGDLTDHHVPLDASHEGPNQVNRA